MIKSTQGSVIGKYHLGIGKNNQDAALMRVYGDKFVGIVCDGCGSCERSEVGSNRAFQVFSKSAVQASQSAVNFSKTAMGGFGG